MEYLFYSEEEILERVDEYALYSHYLGYVPTIGAKYKSPVRKGLHSTRDDAPSFGLFEPKKKKGFHEFVWSDQGTGNAGNIFALVQLMYGLDTRYEAMQKVIGDFGLGGEAKPMVPLEVPERKYADPISIAVTSRPFTVKDLNFWQQFNIRKQILEEYTTTSIKQYWITEQQQVPNYPYRGMGFAYREWDKYQLYFPLQEDRSMRFRHNYTEVCVHGFRQLKYNHKLCIITKSRKDVMCLRSFGYEAISPRSENTLVPAECLYHLKQRYDNILVLFDNDMKHKGDAYEFEKVYVPQVPMAGGRVTKDPTDFCLAKGVNETAQMLSQILGYGN